MLRRGGARVISRSSGGKRAGTGRRISRLRTAPKADRPRRLTGWGKGTLAALGAVLLMFGDAFLTVQVHKLSMETHRLRNDLHSLEVDLGTLESEWASRSSRTELEERALELGLKVPRRDQVVLLPAAFLEDMYCESAPGSAELRRALVGNWMRLSPVGIP
jgi:hypothetical protein